MRLQAFVIATLSLGHTFVVVQTGTKVMETRNVGSFDKPLRVEIDPTLIQVPKIVEICKKYNIFIKEHNADYLSR